MIFTAGEQITGAAGDLVLIADSDVILNTGWKVNSSGHLVPTGAYNLGAAAARPTTSYFAAVNETGTLTITGAGIVINA